MVVTFEFPPTTRESSRCSIFSPAPGIDRIQILATFVACLIRAFHLFFYPSCLARGTVMVLIMVLVFNSLMTYDIEHPVSFGHAPVLCFLFFEDFLPFWCYTMLQAHLILSVSALESAMSPEIPASLYWRTVFRNQELRARCVCCYWDFTASRSFQQTELGNTGIHTYPCLFLYLSVWICNAYI